MLFRKITDINCEDYQKQRRVWRKYGIVMSGCDTGYRHCTVARTQTVQTVNVRTVEFSLLLPNERLKLNYLLADEDELNSSSAPQNQRA